MSLTNALLASSSKTKIEDALKDKEIWQLDTFNGGSIFIDKDRMVYISDEDGNLVNKTRLPIPVGQSDAVSTMYSTTSVVKVKDRVCLSYMEPNGTGIIINIKPDGEFETYKLAGADFSIFGGVNFDTGIINYRVMNGQSYNIPASRAYDVLANMEVQPAVVKNWNVSAMYNAMTVVADWQLNRALETGHYGPAATRIKQIDITTAVLFQATPAGGYFDIEHRQQLLKPGKRNVSFGVSRWWGNRGLYRLDVDLLSPYSLTWTPMTFNGGQSAAAKSFMGIKNHIEGEKYDFVGWSDSDLAFFAYKAGTFEFDIIAPDDRGIKFDVYYGIAFAKGKFYYRNKNDKLGVYKIV